MTVICSRPECQTTMGCKCGDARRRVTMPMAVYSETTRRDDEIERLRACVGKLEAALREIEKGGAALTGSHWELGLLARAALKSE